MHMGKWTNCEVHKKPTYQNAYIIICSFFCTYMYSQMDYTSGLDDVWVDKMQAIWKLKRFQLTQRLSTTV